VLQRKALNLASGKILLAIFRRVADELQIALADGFSSQPISFFTQFHAINVASFPLCVLAHELRFSLFIASKGEIMDCKTKTFVAGIFVSGMLMTPASGFARDHRQWSRDDASWEHRGDRREHFRAREQARQQLDYDLSHHASRKRLAQDDARIRELERDYRDDRRWRR